MTDLGKSPSPVLRIENLGVRFGTTSVIEDLSFAVPAGKTVAVVGESGSGKSVTSLSVMRLERFPTGMDDWRGGDFGSRQGARRERCRRIVTDEQRGSGAKASRREAGVRRTMTTDQAGRKAL